MSRHELPLPAAQLADVRGRQPGHAQLSHGVLRRTEVALPYPERQRPEAAQEHNLERRERGTQGVVLRVDG